MSKYLYYQSLLSLNYDELVEKLLRKYGPAEDDYFREESYQRFLDGKIKSIAKGKFSRTKEGLFCHHIDENKKPKISDLYFIKKYNISFSYQKKERLVYCDLIEHAILHVLIAKETNNKLGIMGYELFLKSMIEEWFIDKKIPEPNWMKFCYNKAFVTPDEAIELLEAMQKTLGLNYFSTLLEYKEYQKKYEKKIILEQPPRQSINKEIQVFEKRIEANKQNVLSKEEQFYKKYPLFKKLNVSPDTSRRKLINLLYEFKYSESFKNKKELEQTYKPVIRDLILDELHSLIK